MSTVDLHVISHIVYCWLYNHGPIIRDHFYECAQPMREDPTLIVTLRFIGWAHTQNDPCIMVTFTASTGKLSV